MSIITKVAGTVGFALCVATAPMAASAKDVLKPRKIGVIVINTGSESLARWANNVQAAAAKLHWDVVIKNGESNPAVVATLLPELLTQGVDAVITMAVDAPLMAQGLTEAKAKNVPVIATVVGVNPAGRDNFTAVYAINDYELGVALANYLVDKNAKAVAVGQTATFTQTAGDLALAHPEANAIISCCDFAPPIDLPALKAAHRDDMTLMTRVDNPSSIQALRAGANLVLAASRTDAYNLAALDVLVDHFAKGMPIPAALPDLKADVKIVDKTNIPTGSEVYPFAQELATHVERWSKDYQF
jgi:ABC-type sugar transport system substrate-binding protein